jgi:hypothetical protein
MGGGAISGSPVSGRRVAGRAGSGRGCSGAGAVSGGRGPSGPRPGSPGRGGSSGGGSRGGLRGFGCSATGFARGVSVLGSVLGGGGGAGRCGGRGRRVRDLWIIHAINGGAPSVGACSGRMLGSGSIPGGLSEACRGVGGCWLRASSGRGMLVFGLRFCGARWLGAGRAPCGAFGGPLGRGLLRNLPPGILFVRFSFPFGCSDRHQ